MRCFKLALAVALVTGASNVVYSAPARRVQVDQRPGNVQQVLFHGAYSARGHCDAYGGCNDGGCNDGGCGDGGCSDCGSCDGYAASGCGSCCVVPCLVHGAAHWVKGAVGWLFCCDAPCATGCGSSCGDGACGCGGAGFDGDEYDLVPTPNEPVHRPGNPFKDDTVSVLPRASRARRSLEARRPVRSVSAPSRQVRRPTVVRTAHTEPVGPDRAAVARVRPDHELNASRARKRELLNALKAAIK